MHTKKLFALSLMLLSLAGASDAQPLHSPLYSLFAPITTAQSQARQGVSVALDGNIAVVGAPEDDVGASDSGVAKVYDAVTGALLHTLVNPTPAANDWFGTAVAISGSRVIVGAPLDNAIGFDSGVAYVYDLTNATPAVPVMTLNNPAGKGDDWFGYSVAASGSLVAIGAYLDDTGTNFAGNVYVYNLTGTNPVAPFITLTNPSPGRGDFFGFAVGISGTRIAVGAHFDDGGAPDAGIAYVFDLSDATPDAPVATLTNPSPAGFDFFGITVAISGTRVVVGAPFGDANATNSGVAYVFDLANADLDMPVAILTNSTPAVDENFGTGLAISGTRVIVGPYQDGPPGMNAGIWYVYDLASGTPTTPVYILTKPASSGGANLASAAAISGSRVILGVPNDSTAAPNAGGAYVFDLASGSPETPTVVLAHPSPVLGDSFGFAVAVSGSHVLVGAFREDTGTRDAGSAYLYDLTSLTPTVPVLTFTNPTPGWEDYFGQAVALSGMRCVIGAPFDDTRATDAGSAYVYDLTGGPTVPFLVLTNPNPSSAGYFGGDVAMDGRYIVVSAFQDDTGTNAAGSVYVYDLLSATPAVAFATLTNPHPTQYGYFGYSVAVSGTRAVVGSLGDDSGAPNAGAAYVYDLAGPAPATPALVLTNPIPAADDGFGGGVAISGARVVVAAIMNDTGPSASGVAYVYNLAAAIPTRPVLTLTNPNPATADEFGYTLAISGARLVVGTYGDDTGADRSGIAYVYDLESAEPVVPVATLFNPTPAAQDFFGSKVAIDGATIVVGAYQDDTNAEDRGAAYIFGIGPKLQITPATLGVTTLSWTPTNSPGFVLQYADAVSPTNWFNAPNGAVNPATIPAANASRFYRLFKP